MGLTERSTYGLNITLWRLSQAKRMLFGVHWWPIRPSFGVVLLPHLAKFGRNQRSPPPVVANDGSRSRRVCYRRVFLYKGLDCWRVFACLGVLIGGRYTAFV